MSVADNALVIFARAPVAGRVKTRLAPVYTPEEACAIHAALVGDVVERAVTTLAGLAAVTLAWSDQAGPTAAAVDLPAVLPVESQPAGDLGERMALTIQAKLRAGHRRVAILGSDAPTLPADHLLAAFEALRTREVVIGPTEDGGYWLVGMSRLHLEIFARVPWGSGEVLQVTRSRLKKSGASFAELGRWYDVDTPVDVARLWSDCLRLKERRSGDLPPRTYRVLARLVPGRRADPGGARGSTRPSGGK